MNAFDQAAERFTLIVKKMVDERNAFAVSLAADGIALVTNRVQRKGEKASGEKFKVPYSRKALNGIYFPDAFRKYAKSNKVVMSYENYRKWRGLRVDIRNLTNEGKMFASIKPVITKSSLNLVEVSFKARDKDNEAKLRHNSKRENTNILALSSKEREVLNGRIVDWLEKIKN